MSLPLQSTWQTLDKGKLFSHYIRPWMTSGCRQALQFFMERCFAGSTVTQIAMKMGKNTENECYVKPLPTFLPLWLEKVVKKSELERFFRHFKCLKIKIIYDRPLTGYYFFRTTSIREKGRNYHCEYHCPIFSEIFFNVLFLNLRSILVVQKYSKVTSDVLHKNSINQYVTKPDQ